MKNKSPVITKCAKTAGIRAGTIQGAMDGEFSAGLGKGDCRRVKMPLSYYLRDPLLVIGMDRRSLEVVAREALYRVRSLELKINQLGIDTPAQSPGSVSIVRTDPLAEVGEV